MGQQIESELISISRKRVVSAGLAPLYFPFVAAQGALGYELSRVADLSSSQLHEGAYWLSIGAVIVGITVDTWALRHAYSLNFWTNEFYEKTKNPILSAIRSAGVAYATSIITNPADAASVATYALSGDERFFAANLIARSVLTTAFVIGGNALIASGKADDCLDCIYSITDGLGIRPYMEDMMHKAEAVGNWCYDAVSNLDAWVSGAPVEIDFPDALRHISQISSSDYAYIQQNYSIDLRKLS